MILSPEAKALKIVFNEFGGPQKSFAELLEVDQSTVSKMMSGKLSVPFHIMRSICFKLGYSPEWLFTMKGNKKSKGSEVKLVTEVSMLRVEIDLIRAELNVLKERLKYYESQQGV